MTAQTAPQSVSVQAIVTIEVPDYSVNEHGAVIPAVLGSLAPALLETIDTVFYATGTQFGDIPGISADVHVGASGGVSSDVPPPTETPEDAEAESPTDG